MLRILAAMILWGALAAAQAAEFKTVAEAAAVLYDGPSSKARPIAVVGRDYPLEVVVSLEGWLKVRDATGALGWVDKRSVSDRRSLMVRTPVADVYAAPDAGSPVVFRAEQNVLLQLDEPASGSAAGWVPVRHRDGQAGFVRLQSVWGY